ncbi:MAG TPA: HIT domain-containing protein [Solirubrobacteraceae bacterium]|nr:HIT domain-containing protein [Solirubrobacteraceae bacterium]
MSEPGEPLYNLAAARSEQQRSYMQALAAAGTCVLCPQNVAREQREPIEHSGEHWYVKRNDYPYAGTLAHYLIVAQRHVVSFDELPDAAGAELWAIKRELKSRLRPLATASVERSGNMLYNGGSIAHLHVHLVALDAAPAATVRFRVSAEAPPG